MFLEVLMQCCDSYMQLAHLNEQCWFLCMRLYVVCTHSSIFVVPSHFLVFICVSVQKKRLFGLSQQNRYEKEQSRTKKASQRDLCVCVSEYPPNKITALLEQKPYTNLPRNTFVHTMKDLVSKVMKSTTKPH